MSMFPAVRQAVPAGGTASSGALPSASRISVSQAQAQMAQTQQQQQPYQNQQQQQSGLTQQSLPRLPAAGASKAMTQNSSQGVLSEQPQPQRPKKKSSSSSGVKKSTNAFLEFASPAASGAPVNSLRFTDARLSLPPSAPSDGGGSGSAAGCLARELDQASLWSSLRLDDLNAFLAEPTLSLAEQALNGVRLPKGQEALAEAVLHAHQALDVSKLPGVRHFHASLGHIEVGSKPRVLFLQMENTPQQDASSKEGDADSGAALVPSVLHPSPAGTLSWRVRLPSELDVAVEHWAAVGGSDFGGLDGPTDEKRYHQAVADRGLFTLRPRRGILAPGETAVLELIYFPKFVGEHVVPLLFQVRGGKHFTVVLHASCVEALPPVFAMQHLLDQPVAQSNHSQHRSVKSSHEESKDAGESALSSSLFSLSLSSNPFLPPSSPPSYSFALSPMPLGLAAADVPLQPFALLNPTRATLKFRVALASLQKLAKDNHGVEVLRLLAPQTPARAGRASASGGLRVHVHARTGESFVVGRVRAGRALQLRWAFRPLEAHQYTADVALQVVAEHERVIGTPIDEEDEEEDMGAEEAADEDDWFDRHAMTQVVRFSGRGLAPAAFALEPFPPASSTLPPAQSLYLPGQLAALSCDTLSFGDLPPFARGSRMLTLRNLCGQEHLRFAFVNPSLRVKRSQWSKGLEADRRARDILQGGEDGGARGALDDGELDLDADELESVHLEFFPARGLLAPGESIQVRADLHAGARSVVLLRRDVAVRVRVVDPEADEDVYGFEEDFTARGGWDEFNATQQSFGTSTSSFADNNTRGSTASSFGGRGSTAQQAQMIDEYGYNRTPSATLGARTPISSSTPAPGRSLGARSRGGVHIDPRTGRPVTSLVGVGQGFAGMDVRVDYPPPQAMPLNVTTLARRTAALRIGDEAQQKIQDEEGRATRHLAPTMAALQSVPARATWFSDATLPIQELAQASSATLRLAICARVLDARTLEEQHRLRREHFGKQQVQQRLPQQLLTEISNPGSSVAQRYFVPQPDPAIEGATAAAALPEHAAQDKLPADATAAAVVEAALLELLRQGLSPVGNGGVVENSFAHLRREPVPFFADLLAGKKPVVAPSASNSASAGGANPSSLSNAPVALQSLSESILSDTLFALMSEAQQTVDAGEGAFNIEETPKLFMPPPQQQQQRQS